MMLMLKNLFIHACLISLLSVSFTGCKSTDIQPLPKAEFTYSTSSNGGIVFNSVSTNSTSLFWDFGDLSVSTSPYVSHTYSRNGSYQVSLTAKGSGGSDVIVKNVTVSNIKGSAVIYKGFNRGKANIDVSVDGTYYGIIIGSYFYSSPPNCGNSYSVTAMGLSEGLHSFTAKENSGPYYYNWSGTFRVVGGQCTVQGLGL